MTDIEPIAHLSDDHRAQSLRAHLTGTARMAAEMAAEFGCGQWGRIAGLWHDLGKYSDDFQKMLQAAANSEEYPHRVDHATAGSIFSEMQLGPMGRILAYLLAGHHAGLPDWQTETSGMAGLSQRLQKIALLQGVDLTKVPDEIAKAAILLEKPKQGSDPAFWIRILFSCLVDADFLDTEAFMQPDKASCRRLYSSLGDLLPPFTKFMEGKAKSAEYTSVNRLRAEILEKCISIAAHPPGIFTLTVPTGGGKTLSSMAFALHHALKYSKKRIIYVIPYTSIIEQTADQFRQIFGENVIEHHSNLDVKDETPETLKQRLATENWDAPVIVTTSVQFFESLFASRSSRCRKLHNIVNSIVILDEVQLLPPEFLNPILFALRELQRNYNVTLVLCTATQPAFAPHKSLDFDFPGLPDMIEIMENPQELYRAFKRTNINVPEDLNRPQNWEELARELARHSSVLCIVNRRDDCRQLHRLMPEGTIHLSALMCGAHRSKVIQHVKERLKQGIPTSVISTQLVEAGVDFDFPVVYRALAGLDSIAQAAGRCNREGHLESGEVVVFIPPSKSPPGHLRQAAEIGRRLLANPTADPLALQQFEDFFRELYWLKGTKGLDAKDIMPDLAPDPQLRFSFRAAASKFHLIDDSAQAPVLVRYGEGRELIEILRKNGPERWLLRKLQRYIVNLPRHVHSRLVAEGAIREIHPGIFVQEHGGLYDPVLGFCPDKSLIYEPDELIV